MDDGLQTVERGSAEDFLEWALRRLWLTVRDAALARMAGGDREALRAERADLAAQRAEAEQQLAAWRGAPGVPYPLDALAERHGLGAFEREALLLASAPRLDLAFLDLFASLRGGPMRAADVDCVLTVLCTTFAERLRARRLFLPGAPLVRHGLVTVEPLARDGVDALLQAEVRVSDAVLAELCGAAVPDARPSASAAAPGTATLAALVAPERCHAELERIATLFAAGPDRAVLPGSAVVLLHGPPGTGKTFAAEALAAAMQRPLVPLDDLQIFDPHRPFAVNVARLLEAAAALGAVVLIDACERLLDRRATLNPHLHTLLDAIDRHPGPVVLCTNRPEALDETIERHVTFRLAFEAPAVRLRERLWRQETAQVGPLAAGIDFARLARQHAFTGAAIRLSARVARSEAARRAPDAPITAADLEIGARSQVRHRLSQYAERSQTHLRLDDLIVPGDVRQQIGEILDAARARPRVFDEWGFAEKITSGRGLSCLFDGEPGTGKTLCAEILAGELGLTLYRINVAQVVDKYVGETEKNLTRIFKEANAAHSLLLFDEADALFASRVNVNSAQDRFANLEINVLLQLMERYDGVVALTTNLKQSIDKAFERRLGFKIHFPFPDAEFRERIWRHLIPARAPLDDDVDFRGLAQSFELSGGSIKNALIRAACRAAAAERALGMADLADAARRECIAAGKIYRSMPVEEEF